MEAESENQGVHETKSLRPAVTGIAAKILRKSEYRVNAKAKSL